MQQNHGHQIISKSLSDEYHDSLTLDRRVTGTFIHKDR